MRFKNIYIEITNICNMNCSFCKKENRPLKFMDVDNFNNIINRIKDYTECIYLHVKGEPLLHPKLKELLSIADDNNLIVNITTNGTLLESNLDTIVKSKCIRQINISLHSNLNDDNYLNSVFKSVDTLLKDTKIYVNYRLWNIQEETDIVKKINDYYDVNIYESNIIRNNLFIETEHPFIWPTLDNKYYNEKGKCYGLINQLAILVNGDIVPCCLDSEAIIKLGNIYDNTLEEVLNSDKAINIIEGFRCNKKIEELCKHCNFLDSRNKSTLE